MSRNYNSCARKQCACCHCERERHHSTHRYRLEVVSYDLRQGIATCLLFDHDKLMRNQGVSIRAVACPVAHRSPLLVETPWKPCRTDNKGRLPYTFAHNSNGECEVCLYALLDDGNVETRVTLAPRANLGFTVLSYMLSDDLSELMLYLVVRRCNTLAVDASGLDHTFATPDQLGPCRSSRAMAIIHIAMGDAYNLLKHAFSLYREQIYANYVVDTTADPLSAIAKAARDTCVALFPQQQSTLAADFDALLSHLQSRKGYSQGVLLGAYVASKTLELRENDGSEVPEPTDAPAYPPVAYGQWTRAPADSNIGGAIALGRYWSDVKMFCGLTKQEYIQQFRCPPFPDFTSPEYALAYNHVKTMGGDGIQTLTARDADETQIGIFWGYDGTPSLCAPPRLYNQLTAAILKQHEKSALLTFRALVMINVGLADAAIACWESKYHYSLWRPVCGIRYPAQVNAETHADPNWHHLGAPATNMTPTQQNFTPPFPAYPSGHSTFGATLVTILQSLLGGDDFGVSFVSDEYNGETVDQNGNVRPFYPRSFRRLSQLALENERSRQYLGVHWCFDGFDGVNQGKKVGQYIADHLFAN